MLEEALAKNSRASSSIRVGLDSKQIGETLVSFIVEIPIQEVPMNSMKTMLASLAFIAMALPAAAQPPAFNFSIATPHAAISVGSGYAAPAPVYPPAYYPPQPYYPPPAYVGAQVVAAPLPIIAPSYEVVRRYPQHYYLYNGRYYRHGYGPRYHNRYR
jgi:hypothetical protein